MSSGINYLAIGNIDHLKRGWAIIPFVGERPHFWIEQRQAIPEIRDGGHVRHYLSCCGLRAKTSSKLPAIVPGNFPKCRKCGGSRVAS